MLGPHQPVILHLLDVEPLSEALNAVKMELIDAALPLLKGNPLQRHTRDVLLFYILYILRKKKTDVVATTDVAEACSGVEIAIMVGGFPREEGMERKDVMSKNVSIYKAHASALDQHAAPHCKVISYLSHKQSI